MSGNNNSKNSRLKSLKPSGQPDLSFFEQVYAIARQIPKGRVTSYGAIARCIGTGKSARLVGWAMSNSSTVRPGVPAHRVVNSAGLLSGKHAFNPPERMQQLLEKEGLTIKNDKVADFKIHFWNPMEEL
ncbi:MGMT family protein [Niabella terrae]